MPDAASTGPRPDAARATHHGKLRVTRDGAVVENLDVVDGSIYVTADDVTIRDVRLRVGSYPHGIRFDGAARGRVEHVEIDGQGRSSTIGIVGGRHLTVRSADIHSVGDGIRLASDSVYEANWIHDLAAGAGAHNDGMQATGGQRIVIRGNRIDHRRAQTSAILLKSDTGSIRDVRIVGNRVSGGTYTVYVPRRPARLSHRCPAHAQRVRGRRGVRLAVDGLRPAPDPRRRRRVRPADRSPAGAQRVRGERRVRPAVRRLTRQIAPRNRPGRRARTPGPLPGRATPTRTPSTRPGAPSLESTDVGRSRGAPGREGTCGAWPL